jgi:hypothetical protein
MERGAQLKFPFDTVDAIVRKPNSANAYLGRSLRLVIEHIVFRPNQSAQCRMAALYAGQSRSQFVEVQPAYQPYRTSDIHFGEVLDIGELPSAHFISRQQPEQGDRSEHPSVSTHSLEPP